MDFNEFKKALDKNKKEATDRAYFNLYQTQLPKEERAYPIDALMLKASIYLIDRIEGKPAQKQIHAGDSENPIYFIPSELAEKYGIQTTQRTKTDNSGQA